MPEELENETKLGAEDNQGKSSVGWDQKETKRAWLMERPLACKGVLERKWQVKALASRWVKPRATRRERLNAVVRGHKTSSRRPGDRPAHL